MSIRNPSIRHFSNVVLDLSISGMTLLHEIKWPGQLKKTPFSAHLLINHVGVGILGAVAGLWIGFLTYWFLHF